MYIQIQHSEGYLFCVSWDSEFIINLLVYYIERIKKIKSDCVTLSISHTPYNIGDLKDGVRTFCLLYSRYLKDSINVQV